MEHKSLRQLARELGVSHSYLSQVRHGKRPASEKVVSKMVSKMVSRILLTLLPLTATNKSGSGRI